MKYRKWMAMFMAMAMLTAGLTGCGSKASSDPGETQTPASSGG